MALSGIQFSGPILVGLNQPVDVKYGPYATTTAALTEIPLTLRHIGLTVGIDDATDGLKEYWFKAGTADLNLVLKEVDASVDLSSYRTSSAQDTIDAGKASTSHAHSELNSPNNIKQIELQNNGDLTLPNGGVISDSAVAEGSITLTPPNAGAGQGLVIRPTVSTWSITSSGYIVYGSPITISVGQLSSGNYFGTVNYAISGNGVTEASLGRALTGAVVFSGTGPETETITWTIPANSDITEFTLTLTSVDGARSTDVSNENDPVFYYSFEHNGMPTNQFVTVTNNGISNSEHSHVHLISADPSTVDLYLGDDDQYVKIERDAGGIVIGNYIQAVAGTISTLPNGLEAFYKLDDLTDSSGNGYALTDVGGVTFSSGKIGNCAVFDGTDKVLKNENISLAGSSELTLSLWVKTSNFSQQGTNIVGIWGNSNGADTQFEAYYDSSSIGLIVQTPGAMQTPPSTMSIADGNWHHCVLVFKDGNKVYGIYDGVKTDINNFSTTTISNNIAYFGIGRTSQTMYGGVNHFDGEIDAVGVWNRALSDAEAAELYNSGAGKETPFSTGSLAVSNQWNFKTNGTLELPAGGDITMSGSSVLGGGGGGGVQANWNSTSGPSSILNKPTLATVATSGSYTDLSNKPTLGTAAATDATAYATAAQGTTANSALQASALTPYRTSTAQDTIDAGKATSAQGAKADSASQPGHGHSLSNITVSGATNGQVPAWNGTAWVPSTPTWSNLMSVVQMTLAQYQALGGNVDSNTLYIIVG